MVTTNTGAKIPTARGSMTIGVFVVMSTIATLTVGLRTYVVLRVIKRRMTYEDWFAGGGCLLFLAFSGLAVTGCFYGTGQHFYTLSLQQISTGIELLYFYAMTFVLANMAVKQGITLLLLRYAVDDLHKKVVYIVTFALQFYSIVTFFAILFRCIPISFWWTQVLGNDGRCIDKAHYIKLTYGYSALLVVYDLTMAILPWFMVRRLQLDLRTRLMVTAVLALGSVACIVTIVRIPYLTIFGKSKEPLYDEAITAILSCLETGLSVTASSAATLRPLFRRRSSQIAPAKPGRPPKLNTIPSTTANSSTLVSAKEGDLEFCTTFQGSNP